MQAMQSVFEKFPQLARVADQLNERLVLIDVFALAGLYTLRLIAGSAALGLWPSFWLSYRSLCGSQQRS